MTTAGHEMLLSVKLDVVSFTACHNNKKQNSKNLDVSPLMSPNHYFLGAFLGSLMKATMAK